jgi:hypothetical protein
MTRKPISRRRVKGDQLLPGVFGSMDIEGDPLLAKEGFGLYCFSTNSFAVFAVESAIMVLIGAAHICHAARAGITPHLVENIAHPYSLS